VSWIGRVKLLIELPSVVTIDKQTQGTLKYIETTREATRRSCQTGQVVAQLGVVSFNRVRVGFAFRNFISAEVIPQAIISIKRIAVILFGLLRTVHQLLISWLSALPDHFPAQITARLPVYDGEDVDPVFFIADKSEKLIHFGSLDLFRYRHFRQAGCTGFDPQGNRAVVEPQMACDPVQVHAIHIVLHGLLTYLSGIAVQFRFGRALLHK